MFYSFILWELYKNVWNQMPLWITLYLFYARVWKRKGKEKIRTCLLLCTRVGFSTGGTYILIGKIPNIFVKRDIKRHHPLCKIKLLKIRLSQIRLLKIGLFLNEANAMDLLVKMNMTMKMVMSSRDRMFSIQDAQKHHQTCTKSRKQKSSQCKYNT